MWKPRPNHSAPATVVVELVLAALYALAMLRLGAQDKALWMFPLVLVLMACGELLLYFWEKRAAARYDEGVRSGTITPERVEADELRRLRVITGAWAAFGLLWCGHIVNDLLKDPPWVNNAVYHGLFALVCFALAGHMFHRCKQRREGRKEE